MASFVNADEMLGIGHGPFYLGECFMSLVVFVVSLRRPTKTAAYRMSVAMPRDAQGPPLLQRSVIAVVFVARPRADVRMRMSHNGAKFVISRPT
jgi:hypothetical protein